MPSKSAADASTRGRLRFRFIGTSRALAIVVALCAVFIDAAYLAPAHASAIAAGIGHTLFLRDDGTVLAWGSNWSGQLGDGTTIDRGAPVLVMSGVQAVAAGSDHSLAVKTDGSVWAWGDGRQCQRQS